MSCPCEFEPAIQVSCGLELVAIVRSGQLIEKRADVLQHVGCIVGSLGAYMKGEGQVSPPVQVASAPMSLDQCCDAITNHVESVGVQALNPALVALLLRLAELLIKKYLE